MVTTAGVADDFDGSSKGLSTSSEATLLLALEGYRTVTRNIYVQPDSTYKLKETMEKLAPAESANRCHAGKSFLRHHGERLPGRSPCPASMASRVRNVRVPNAFDAVIVGASVNLPSRVRTFASV